MGNSGDLTTSSESDIESVLSKSNENSTSQTSKPNSLKCGERRELVCSIVGCEMKFSRVTNLDRHEFREHTGIKKHICSLPDCSKSYITSTHLKRHIKTFHERFVEDKTIKCRIESCGKMFSSVFNMERHMKTHLNGKIYKCSICDASFKRKMHSRRHLVKHTGDYPFKCTKCKKGFLDKFRLDRHKCKNYNCEWCKESFEKWSELINHKKLEHLKPYQCGQCNKNFGQKTRLEKHLEIHNLERVVINCPYESCEKFYHHSKNLKQHLKLHHEGKKLKCSADGCDAEFSSKQRLSFHIKMKHEVCGIENKTKNLNNSKIKKTKKGKKKARHCKKSMASKLAGIIIKPTLEKHISNSDIDIVIKDHSDEFSETENNDVDKKIGILIELHEIEENDRPTAEA